MRAPIPHVHRSTSLLAVAALAVAAVSIQSEAQTTPGADGSGDVETRMALAAEGLLESLDAAMREQAMRPLDDPNRRDWHYIPRRRAGVSLGEMTDAQRRSAHDLLRAALSQRGYLKTNAIIELEEVLYELQSRPGDPAEHRDPGRYFITIFGDPASPAPWGWRFEGHHLSLNFTSVTGEVAVTPSFLGANPAEVQHGPNAGLRALADEIDLARALLASFTDEQRERAIIAAEAPRDIILSPGREANGIGDPVGVRFAEMTGQQRATLMRLISVYTENLEAELAREQMAQIREAGLDAIHFAWAGATEPGRGHYYRIHGPTFVIEYDNTQNGANHVHTVWRDLTNDFGEDLLRRHYDRHEHE